jgi:membrane AbrB-like protein
LRLAEVAGIERSFRRFGSLSSTPIAVQWAILLAISVLFVVILESLHLPAALMLGPMLAAILVATAHGSVHVPRILFMLAQAVVGCMIARVMRPSLIGEIVADWPLFIAAVFSVIVVSAALGWLLARWRVLPGSTAVWGAFPGAATAMVLMAEAYNADVRLVAFMQYLRVVCVASTASAVARLWSVGGKAAAVSWFAPIAPLPFAETLALAGPGALIGHFLRVPAGPLLLLLVLGAVLQDTRLIVIDLPPGCSR